MADYIPNQNLSAMFGGSLGSSLGGGLGQGLQTLAQNKMGEMHRSKNKQMLQKALNVDENTAELLSQLQESNPSGFNNILGMLGGGSNPQQQMGGQQIGQGLEQGNQQQMQGDQQQMQGNQQQMQQGNQEPQQQFNRIMPQKETAKEDVRKEIADQARIEPFLKGQYEDFNMSKKLNAKAKSMLEILKKNKSTWPGAITGRLPETFHRNADVRKYIADGGTLVTLLANSRKGQPTNAKIRFEQLSKPNLDQPWATQKALLEDIIKDTNLVFDTNKNIEKIRRENGGKFPADIRQRILEGGLEAANSESNDEGYPDPKSYPIDKKLKKDGVTIINTPDGWKKVS